MFSQPDCLLSFFGSSHKSVHERCVWQVAHAVVQVADEMFSGSESVGLVADHLGLVVEPFDRAVIDGHMKPGQDVLLMAANHPGEFANGLQPGMRCPPEPLLQILPGPGLCFVGP